MKKIITFIMAVLILFSVVSLHASAQPSLNIDSPSAILIEKTTGKVLFEKDADRTMKPASVTKIMTLILIMEAIENGQFTYDDVVVASANATSMGGSQVYLAEGEIQTLDTMIKCIAVSSGNDASVAVAEHIAGSEDAFVALMNEKAAELGMADTHFEDCCGLSDSDNHYTTAKDVAIMSRELITKYPDIYNYTQIWMEDIIHETRQGSTNFTLASTNKLLKQYQWTTGLKTGSTSKAKFCLSATARKDDIDMIAVIMGAPDYKVRFQDAQTLLNYGFSVSELYVDPNTDPIADLQVEGGVEDLVPIQYAGEFRYLDLSGTSLNNIEKQLDLPKTAKAPITQGQQAGEATYYLNGQKLGSIPIIYSVDIPKATYKDYLKKVFGYFLLT